MTSSSTSSFGTFLLCTSDTEPRMLTWFINVDQQLVCEKIICNDVLDTLQVFECQRHDDIIRTQQTDSNLVSYTLLNMTWLLPKKNAIAPFLDTMMSGNRKGTTKEVGHRTCHLRKLTSQPFLRCLLSFSLSL